MSAKLPTRPPVQATRGVYLIEKVLPSGWSLGMIAVQLPDEQLLLYSPVYGGEQTFADVEALGRPRWLVAPNHFHHLSLPRFVARYPDARVVTSAAALPRLKKKGHATLQALDEGQPPAPAVSWHIPPGTRTGEVWLTVAGPDGPALIVADAFFHIGRPVSGPIGVALRALKVAPGLKVSLTFKWGALKDAKVYGRWALDFLHRVRPVHAVFSHGAPVHGEDLPERLAAAVRVRLTS